MADLTEWLSSFLGSPVLDRTGFTGRYDYTQRIEQERPQAGESLRLSYLIFVRELNLKVTKTKGPIEALVIDSAQKPSPN